MSMRMSISALVAQVELCRIVDEKLCSANFTLQKYVLNSSKFLDSLQPELVERVKPVNMEGSAGVSVLGICWDPVHDTFRINLNLPIQSNDEVLTKRKILSEIARTFDPLGLITPVTIRAKILLQRLWREDLEWDSQVSESISRSYQSYCNELNGLTEFSVTRHYGSKSEDISLIGFCDASKSAYCATVYLRIVSPSSQISTSLVCAKSRVAPIKQLTIPRLELTGAVLLCELLSRVSRNLKIESNKIHAYKDSTVVLGWIKAGETIDQYKLYVRNRVQKINEFLPVSRWGYVNTKQNPADLGKRGLPVSTFVKSKLWLFGPQFISELNYIAGPPSVPVYETERERLITTVTTLQISEEDNYLLSTVSKFSSYRHLLSVFAICLKAKELWLCCPSREVIAYRRFSMNFVIRLIQISKFPTEFWCLQDGKPIPKSSTVQSLSPFLCREDEVLRVGGRLEESSYSYQCKYPIIIPAKSHLAILMVRDTHETYFHAGPSFIKSFLSYKYWFTGGLNNISKRVVRECVICRRYKAQATEVVIGQLPAARVVPSRPFSTVGVDLASRLWAKCVGHRSTVKFKVYAAIFVCFSVKAVHLELLLSLSMQSFLDCLHRFVGRRGVPHTIWSDNDTNFVGCKNYLQTLPRLAAQEGINWRFIPPRTPHQGGLWESAVRSFKFHLIWSVGVRALTFKEYSTLFARTEAILNSRPLCKGVPSNPGAVLTPSHFLVGSPLLCLPEPESEASPIKMSTRYHLLADIQRSFWNH